MKIKKFLIIDDEWKDREQSYEALKNNLASIVQPKYDIGFQFLKRWVDLGISIQVNDFDAIISDVFLENKNNEKDWPQGNTVQNVLNKLPLSSDIPVFVLSSQWNKGDAPLLNEMAQHKNVRSLLMWDSVTQEEDYNAYVSMVICNEIFPKTRYSLLEDTTTITILHCSDFHYKGKSDLYDIEARLDALYRVLLKELDFKNDGCLHFMCMGGDFVDQGAIELYPELKNIFAKFFTNFIEQKIPLTILTVPGNHDYNREMANLLCSNSYLINSIFFPYWDFAKSISVDMNNLLSNPNDMWIFNETSPLGFYFYGINAELQDKDEYKDDKKFIEYKGYISEDNLAALRKINQKLTTTHNNKDIISIGLLHRTINPKNESNQMDIKNNIPTKFIRNYNLLENAVTLDTSSPIFLCGDLHASTASTAMGGTSHGILSSAPPFMGEPSNTLGQGFNLIFLRKNGNTINKVEIHNFTYNKEDEKFEKNDSRFTSFTKGHKRFNQD